MPSLCPLCLDGDANVRATAASVLRSMLETVESAAKGLAEEGSAGHAAGSGPAGAAAPSAPAAGETGGPPTPSSWGQWAVSSVGSLARGLTRASSVAMDNVAVSGAVAGREQPAVSPPPARKPDESAAEIKLAAAGDGKRILKLQGAKSLGSSQAPAAGSDDRGPAANGGAPSRVRDAALPEERTREASASAWDDDGDGGVDWGAPQPQRASPKARRAKRESARRKERAASPPATSPAKQEDGGDDGWGTVEGW